jgi:hypothetical protein
MNLIVERLVFELFSLLVQCHNVVQRSLEETADPLVVNLCAMTRFVWAMR